MTNQIQDARNIRGRWRDFFIAFPLLLAPMLLWSLASPLMSVPDEPSHAIRAVAVAHGDFTGHPDPETPWQIAVTVPADVAHTHELTCFAFKPDVTADCQTPVAGDPEAPTSATTSAGINSPVYYAIVGGPSLFLSGNAALYGMRFVNAIVCAALLALTFMSLRQLPHSRWAVLAAAVSVTPMVLFLGGSINPNGMEIAATSALFATLLATFRTSSGQGVLWERGGIVILSAAVLTNTRSIALLWVLLAIVGALLLSRAEILKPLFRKWTTWVIVVSSALVSLLAVAWYLRPAETTGGGPAFDGVGTSAGTAFGRMIIETLDYAREWIGLFGWVDRAAPTVTIMIWTAVIFGIVAAALALARGRACLAVAFFSACVILVPAFTQAAIVTEMGYIWQGRYTLALLVCLLIAAGIALDIRFPLALSGVDGRRATAAIAGLLAIGHLAAFVWTLKRYVVGERASFLDMVSNPDWQPPLGWILLTLAFALSLGVASWVCVRAIAEPASPRASPNLERHASSQ
ncbi:DUF2142 domain-containing protein [Glaciibacter superstes]|uniref:DUF2142 domain-containing protein n=1 Tax=Glaciibacter superstes TaxID=501023 RepID=UPI0003B5F123|nr:DUF2142 domain-containing protein [Glaciibacter superstes]